MINKNYSDIIVGAGSAGCVIAARISEDPHRQVLLVEAGPDYPDERELPTALRNGLVPDLATHDWGFTISGNHFVPMPAPRGKVVGGSSAINTCIALRAEKTDFEEWARLGIVGWTWETMLHSYMNVENDRDFAGLFHCQHGPVTIKRWARDELVPPSQSFLNACIEHGFASVADLNQPDTSGVGILPMNMVNGMRQSSALCFLNPVRHRSNLTILSGTIVNKLIFDGTRAKGIVLANRTEAAEIKGERIILSAGSYGTPAILLRSGVGFERDLQQFGIETVLNLPGVGKNLMDHPQCYIAVAAIPGKIRPNVPCAQVLLKYSSNGGKYHNDMQLSLLNWVDLEKFAPQIVAEVNNYDVFTIMVQLERPVVRGKVILRSSDPNVLPLVELDYCAEEEDLFRLREGLRLGWKILKSAQLQPFVKSVVGLRVEDINDDERLNQYIRTHVLTSHHPMGTAHMGLIDDSDVVVDSQCQVLGARQLWVGDASIIPVPLRANTNLTCFAIGERISKLLKETI